MQNPADFVRRQEAKQESMDMLAGKTSKQEAVYEDSPNRPTAVTCGECANYELPREPNSTCSAVAGTVYSDDTCSLFTPADQGPPVGDVQSAPQPENF